MNSIILFSLLSFPSAPSSEAPLSNVIVLPLQDETKRGLDALQLSGNIVAHLKKAGAQRVIGIWEVESLSSDVEACEQDATCILKIIDAEEESYIISGQVGPVGEQFLLHLALIDQKTAHVRARAGTNFEKPREAPQAVRSTIDQLLREARQEAQQTGFRNDNQSETSFAVLDLEPLGISAQTASILTHELTREVKQVNGSRVYNRADIEALIGIDKLRMILSGDCERSCLSEITGALDVHYFVMGSVGRLGDTFHINLSLLDQSPDRLGRARRISEVYEGSEDDLARAVSHAARQLLEIDIDLPGQLRLRSRLGEGGIFSVDGQDMGSEPVPVVASLEPGRHVAKLERTGYFTKELDIYIRPGETTQTYIELEEIPWEWHKSWWVWTLIGTAVVGATVVSVAALQQEPTSGDGLGRFP